MFGIHEIQKIYTNFIFHGLNHWNVTGNDSEVGERIIDITEVTPREADQSPGTSMNRYEKLALVLGLKQAGIPIIEIGFPANPIDYDNTKLIMDHIGDGKGENAPIVSVLGRANKKDTEKSLEILEGYNKPRIHIFIATSQSHMKEKFGKGSRGNFSMDQLEDYVIEQMQESLDAALEFKERNSNLEIEISLEVANDTEKDFFTRFIKKFDIAEVTCINIPDTMGELTEDGTRSMFQYASEITEHVELSTHNHNDRGLADSNSITAAKNGAHYIESTLLGAGEGPGNADTVTMVNNIAQGDIFDADGKKLVLPESIVPQEVGYVADLFKSIVNFNKNPQAPFVGELAFEDAAGVHAAAKSVYRAGIDSQRYGHQDVEEFFSARGGETQMISMMAKHGIEIPKNTSDISSPQANYWMRRCIKTSEREKYLYSRDMLALYLEANGVLNIGNIVLEGKKIQFNFNYNGKQYCIEGEGGDNQGFIHGFVRGISDFLGEETEFKLIGVDPKNKTHLRQSVGEYLNISERTTTLLDEYKYELMSIVQMSERNDYLIPVRDKIDRLLLSGIDTKTLDSFMNKIAENSLIENPIEEFHTILDSMKVIEGNKKEEIKQSFRNAISEIRKYEGTKGETKKGGSQLGICVSQAEINGERVHSTVSGTNLDHATLTSIFRTALPEIIKKIDSYSE